MAVHWIRSKVPYDSNIFLITGERSVLVDAGTGLGHEGIVSGIRKVLNGRGLDMIVLTHCHFDHVGGAKALADEFGADVLIGIGDSPYLTNGDTGYSAADLFGGDLEPMESAELTEGDMIDVGEHRLRVICTPGHTAGSICLYDEVTSSLFSGDTVFNYGIGRTDFMSGSASDMVSSLRRLSELDVKDMYPGHSECSRDGNRSIEYGLMMMGAYN